jgi:hypothetical protein
VFVVRRLIFFDKKETTNIEFYFTLALTLSITFGVVVLYLQCRRSSLSGPVAGFQRYEPLVNDEDASLLVSEANENKALRNTHAMPSESEDEGDNVLFASNINKPLLA